MQAGQTPPPRGPYEELIIESGPFAIRDETCSLPYYAKLFSMGRRIRPPAGIRSPFAWSGAGFFVYGACQWAILAILARHTEVADFGEYSLALAIAAPVALLTGLQLRVVQGTDARGAYNFADYL